MAVLVYSIQCSLDGFIEDASGDFNFAAPGEELHAAINERERAVGTYLFGRRVYETMRVWDEWDTTGEPEPVVDYQRIWNGIDKIVYSSSLDSVSTVRTRLERSFDPDAVRELKQSAGANLSIGGAALAASAFRAGLVDEVNLIVFPIAIGSGKPALPTDQRIELELMDTRRFEDGAVHLHYRVLDPSVVA